MLVRTILWGLACAVALVGCSSEKTAKGAEEGKAPASGEPVKDKDGKAGKAAKDSQAPATATPAVGAEGKAAAPANGGAAAGGAAAPGGTTAAKQGEPGEQPLHAQADDDVEAAFPARREPDKELPEELRAQIRSKLRVVSKAPIALRDAIYLPQEDGSAEVIGLYELSAYEDCVQRATGSKRAARRDCLPAKETLSDYDSGEEETTEVQLNTNCRLYGLVHASFAPKAKTAAAPGAATAAATTVMAAMAAEATATPPAKKKKKKAAKDDAGAEANSSLRIAHRPLEEASCEVTSLDQFFLADVDRDERRELVLGITTEREVIESGRRSQSVATRSTQLLWVLEVGEVGAEMPEQLALTVSEYGTGRTVWVDLNRDERVDLVQVADCEDPPYGMGEPCVEEELKRTWLLYDRELDRWVDDQPKPIAAPKPPAAPPVQAAPTPAAAPAPVPAATSGAGGAK